VGKGVREKKEGSVIIGGKKLPLLEKKREGVGWPVTCSNIVGGKITD